HPIDLRRPGVSDKHDAHAGSPERKAWATAGFGLGNVTGPRQKCVKGETEMRPGYSLPGYFRVMAGLLPGYCQGIARQLPGYCEGIARIFPGVRLPQGAWHRTAETSAAYIGVRHPAGA